MSDPQRPHGLQPSRLLCPWDFPGKSTGVGCHCLLPRAWQPTPIFLPGEAYGQRSLEGYGPWGCRKSDVTEQLILSLFTFTFHELKRFCTPYTTYSMSLRSKVTSPSPDRRHVLSSCPSSHQVSSGYSRCTHSLSQLGAGWAEKLGLERPSGGWYQRPLAPAPAWSTR